MAEFTFTIRSEDEKEMSGLMVRLFGHGVSDPNFLGVRVPAKSTLTHPDDDAQDETVTPAAEPVRRTRRTKAEIAATALEQDEAKVEEAANATDEPAEEITLDMVRAAGSKAMGIIKASGVNAIFKSVGGGAETFGSLQPDFYGAVYDALIEAVQ